MLKKPAAERLKLLRNSEGKQGQFLWAILRNAFHYAAVASARGGIASVLANGSDASSYEVFETEAGDYAIRLVAANGEVIARGESYSSKANATRAVSHLTEVLAGNIKTTEQ